ncbi:MAG TPA: DUF4242 domain-containing protein [Balneolaceae bacterium]|nr:DUF4242 domain-containing protein [Balneolaceae bacterium]
MPKYLIERDAPGVGNLSARDLQALSLKSNKVLKEMGDDIQWQESYVSGDKLYCVYIARDEDLIREHAKRGEFPLTNIFPVKTMIDPTTGENNE